MPGANSRALTPERRRTASRCCHGCCRGSPVVRMRMPKDHYINLRRGRAQRARTALSRGPRIEEIAKRHWEPAQVYVIHIFDEKLYKVGVTRHDTRRIKNLIACGRGGVVDVVEMANRFSAEIVETAALEATESHRTVPTDVHRYGNGAMEFWSATLDPPSLEEFREEVAMLEGLPFWSVTARLAQDGIS